MTARCRLLNGRARHVSGRLWLEHLRQHERVTHAERQLQDEILALQVETSTPASGTSLAAPLAHR